MNRTEALQRAAELLRHAEAPLKSENEVDPTVRGPHITRWPAITGYATLSAAYSSLAQALGDDNI